MPLKNQHLNALQRCFIQPYTVQSNYARARALEVAELVSRGLITTHAGNGVYSKHWRVTSAGLALLDYNSGESK
jgi:hypothetical protein